MKRPRSAKQLANDERLRHRADAANNAKLEAARVPSHAQPIARPVRARQERLVANGQERRRRKVGSLNKMAQYKLDIFDPEQLDPSYIYRWVTGDGARLRMVTRQDDYEYVNASEIPDFNIDDTDSEGGERIRMLAGKDGNGRPEYQYLLKKRRDFWEEDNARAQEFRDATLEGRVYHGEVDSQAPTVTTDGEKASGSPDLDVSQVYVPREAHLEHGLSGRRRGPVQP